MLYSTLLRGLGAMELWCADVENCAIRTVYIGIYMYICSLCTCIICFIDTLNVMQGCWVRGQVLLQLRCTQTYITFHDAAWAHDSARINATENIGVLVVRKKSTPIDTRTRARCNF